MLSHFLGTTFELSASLDPASSALAPDLTSGTVVASLRNPAMVEVAVPEVEVQGAGTFVVRLPVAMQSELVPDDYTLFVVWVGPGNRRVPFSPVAIRMMQHLVPAAEL